MDGVRHDAHRKVTQPVAAPRNITFLEPLIRRRIIEILDELPAGETFDWVDRVSIEVTTGMLATLFDFPWERRKLTFWSDMATTSPNLVGSVGITEEERQAALLECLDRFTALWKERQQRAPTGASTSSPRSRRRKRRATWSRWSTSARLVLLIVGGNDTTRNSISGGVPALNENPSSTTKLRAPRADHQHDHEIIRWQTPFAYMRRTATQDTELAGKKIAKGAKVAMARYASANRDEDVFEKPNDVPSSTARTRASTSRSDAASTSAWAAASRRCSCACCGGGAAALPPRRGDGAADASARTSGGGPREVFRCARALTPASATPESTRIRPSSSSAASAS